MYAWFAWMTSKRWALARAGRRRNTAIWKESPKPSVRASSGVIAWICTPSRPAVGAPDRERPEVTTWTSARSRSPRASWYVYVPIPPH